MIDITTYRAVRELQECKFGTKDPLHKLADGATEKEELERERRGSRHLTAFLKTKTVA